MFNLYKKVIKYCHGFLNTSVSMPDIIVCLSGQNITCQVHRTDNILHRLHMPNHVTCFSYDIR